MNNFLLLLTPWEFSPLVIIAIITAAGLYIKTSGQAAIYRKICFWVGLFLFYICLQTDFDYYSEHEFFMHRAQHSILHHFAPFLIALSAPGNLFRLKLPAFLNNYIAAPLIFCSLIIFWLIPPIQFYAMIDWRLYRIMNWSIAINGLMFWNAALNSQKPVMQKIMMMLFIIPPQIIIGLILTFSSHELFPVYSLCGRAFGTSPLVDQQIGGAILWMSAAMMAILGIWRVLAVSSSQFARADV